MNRPPDTGGYAGPAVLRLGDASVDVQADLRGRFEPIDGRHHWYGRLARCDAIATATSAGHTAGTLTTPAGTTECQVSDPDLWQRYRVRGTSRTLPRR